MPRISKIRITGAKYDNFKKGYEDSLFDLSKGDEPDHTLFTLVNQGGKGVLMQLLSQITMPDTRWGRESGNKIISMFYDRYRNFSPYTFHVAIDWKLDTIPEKWLITGVCITAERKISTDDQDDRIGINYFHYTIEHDSNGFFSIENLPLYDKKDKSPVGYDEFEKFVNENAKYIIKYPMNQTRRLNSKYYEYLRNRGIERSEWEIMKVINKYEGGVSSYFSSASDNKSVIDRMIIPAITQNMNNYNENAGESLKEMFISNLYITKDLPSLLERENDYRQLLILLSPLIECASEGLETQKQIRIHVTEGNNILATLNNMAEKEHDKKAHWEEQLKSALNEQENLNFEFDNLEYAGYKRDQREILTKLSEAELAIGELTDKLNTSNNNKKEIEADILIKIRDEFQKEKQQYIDKRQYLIENLDIEDLKKEILRMEEIIKGKWEENKLFFEEIAHNHYSYQNYLEQKNTRFDEDKKSEEKRIRAIREKIAVFEDRRKRHKDSFQRLTNYFDILRLAMPVYLLQELKEESKKRENEIKKRENELKENKEELNSAGQKKYKKEVTTKSLNKDLEINQSKFDDARKTEEILKSSICRVENVEPVTVVYTHSWAQSQVRAIDEMITDVKQKADNLKMNLWELNVDFEINNRDYWIPNNDILILKRAVEGIGVTPVQTGTEFLYGLEDKLRHEMIKKFPLLPYGIVIPSEREWELIEKNIDSLILLRAAVPVFIRRNMKESDLKSVVNTGHRMAVDLAEFNLWYHKLGDESSGIKASLEVLEKRITTLQDLKNDIVNITKSPESNEILKLINQIKTDISKTEHSISELSTQISKLNEKISEITNEIEKLKALEVQDSERIAKLEAYVEEDISINELKKDNDINVVEAHKLEGRIEDIELKKKKKSGLLIEDEKNFVYWDTLIKHRLEQLKICIPSAFLKQEKSGDSVDSSPLYNTEGINDIFGDVEKRLGLDREVNARNAEVSVLDEKIRNMDEKINGNENALSKTIADWKQRKISEKSKDQLEHILSDFKNDITLIENNLNENISISKELKGALDQLEKSISNVRRRLQDKYNRQAEPWQNLDLIKKRFELQRNIEACKKMINSTKVFIDEAVKRYNDISISLSGLSRFEELEMGKGTVDEFLFSKLEKETQKVVDMWQDEYKKLKKRLSGSETSMRGNLESFRNSIRSRVKEKILMEKLLIEIQNINIENFKGNLDAFTSMQNHFRKELEAASSDKKMAEQVREQWAQRAAKHIIRIVELMKEMVHGMVYINSNNHAFPIIQLKGEETMPTREDDVLILLKEHFVASINEVVKMELQPDDVDFKMLDNLMGDQVLFSRALRGRYPIVMVYKMTEKNEFKYAKPHEYYYASWEAINRGEEGSAEGSGGQKLSICTFMMMMLVNFKKRSTGNKRPWTVLIMDNPFGQASAKHILDPVFEIANSLNFQIIAFAPPEIIKIDISKRFPVFWELRIEENEQDRISVMSSRLIHGGRILSAM